MTGTSGVRGQTEKHVRQRKNKRVRVRFPVTVEVPEGGDRARKLTAHTVVVSHAGATLDMDESVAVGAGIQVRPPFGGTILAEVTDAWLDHASGRHRIGIRLIDPASWTSPERLQTPTVAARDAGSLHLSPRAWQMLDDYTAYLSEREDAEMTATGAAERIIEEIFLSDANFQNWFATKIMEDLQAWEEASVTRA